jgi:hypothetical protein
VNTYKYYALFLAVFPLFSCATRIDGSLASNGASQMSVNTALMPRITSLVRTLAAAGGQENSLLLNGPALAKSMTDASSGNVTASFKNTSPSAIEGNLNIKNINRFLSSLSGKAERFVEFEQGKNGGKCKFYIDLSGGYEVLNLISPEIAAYLSALMAPVATGEEMTKTEYLELVSSVFSKAVSDEIASSKIRISVNFPGQVTSAAGGTFKGKTAEFDIPLLDVLVLETPLTYEVSWK